MPEVVTLFAIALLSAGLSVAFFSGRGIKLIAGYNTASPEQRARYDERRLCRAVGFIAADAACSLSVVALAELAHLYGVSSSETADWVAFAAFVAIFAGIVVGIWRVNTTCYHADHRR